MDESAPGVNGSVFREHASQSQLLGPGQVPNGTASQLNRAASQLNRAVSRLNGSASGMPEAVSQLAEAILRSNEAAFRLHTAALEMEEFTSALTEAAFKPPGTVSRSAGTAFAWDGAAPEVED